jgi:ParB-like chromosome segregation protein Spo0J
MRYQLLPDLSEAEYAALKAHIAAWGIQVPVVRDEHGHTLDGHHRERAAKELGIKNYPVRTLSGLTEEQKRHYVLAVNVQRRHLTGKQKRELIATELRQGPDISDN